MVWSKKHRCVCVCHLQKGDDPGCDSGKHSLVVLYTEGKARAPKQNHKTSQDVGSMSEKQLPILMACCLSVTYEVNQLRAVPDIPYHIDKRVMRMSWSMVSKPADR